MRQARGVGGASWGMRWVGVAWGMRVGQVGGCGMGHEGGSGMCVCGMGHEGGSRCVCVCVAWGMRVGQLCVCVWHGA